AIDRRGRHSRVSARFRARVDAGPAPFRLPGGRRDPAAPLALPGGERRVGGGVGDRRLEGGFHLAPRRFCLPLTTRGPRPRLKRYRGRRRPNLRWPERNQPGIHTLIIPFVAATIRTRRRPRSSHVASCRFCVVLTTLGPAS